YGRLSVILKQYADRVSLVEPSHFQLDRAEHFLQDHADIERLQQTADALQFPDDSVDLITMIRVLHHLPNPAPELREIARILSPDGYAVIEVANYSHFRNR